MIEQPEDNQQGPVSPGRAYVPNPVAVTLPDGSHREFPHPVTGADLAAAIGPGLAKAAIAIRVDDRPRDLAAVIDRDASVAIITRDTPEGLEILRHDAAHVMAEAVKELYPDTQVTFGPATDTGFYYDFARAEPFTPEDLDRIEARMREIVRRDETITREVWERGEAVGSVFWHPKGWTLYRIIEDHMRRRLDAADYLEVKAPQLLDRSLWEASGHWENFGENMFIAQSRDEKTLALKPMSCPGHVLIFRNRLRSYRELPLRLAEFGSCHRNEPSGALHGIMRVRAFTQDDAHIFCTEDQVTAESIAFCDLLLSVYRDFGFDDVAIKFADRPPVRAGSDEVWDRAEAALRDAVEAAGLSYTLNPGEGAFYGPKLEFVLRDALGRDWQCGTLQLDFVLPERLDASYVGEDGARHRPAMLHRAIFGSLERFIGILIEHYAGRFPLWLAPVQAVVATITSEAAAYAEEVARECASVGLRVELDTGNEKINYKVREHSLAKVPILLVVGGREATNRTVALQRLGGKEQEALALGEAVARLKEEATVPSSS